VKLLIDECVDQRLRFLFSGHACETADYAKLSGLKNGALLAAAEAADFEVLVTTDQEIPHQQNLALRKISVLILCAPTKRLADLRRLVPSAIEAPGSIKPGQVVRTGRN
jgi:predicted nuclease of predicted toxin-antitoxin system